MDNSVQSPTNPKPSDILRKLRKRNQAIAQQADLFANDPSPTIPLDTPFGTAQGPPESMVQQHLD